MDYRDRGRGVGGWTSQNHETSRVNPFSSAPSLSFIVVRRRVSDYSRRPMAVQTTGAREQEVNATRAPGGIFDPSSQFRREDTRCRRRVRGATW
jgi:hypothetical protein